MNKMAYIRSLIRGGMAKSSQDSGNAQTPYVNWGAVGGQLGGIIGAHSVPEGADTNAVVAASHAAGRYIGNRYGDKMNARLKTVMDRFGGNVAPNPQQTPQPTQQTTVQAQPVQPTQQTTVPAQPVQPTQQTTVPAQPVQTPQPAQQTKPANQPSPKARYLFGNPPGQKSKPANQPSPKARYLFGNPPTKSASCSKKSEMIRKAICDKVASMRASAGCGQKKCAQVVHQAPSYLPPPPSQNPAQKDAVRPEVMKLLINSIPPQIVPVGPAINGISSPSAPRTPNYPMPYPPPQEQQVPTINQRMRNSYLPEKAPPATGAGVNMAQKMAQEAYPSLVEGLRSRFPWMGIIGNGNRTPTKSPVPLDRMPDRIPWYPKPGIADKVPVNRPPEPQPVPQPAPEQHPSQSRWEKIKRAIYSGMGYSPSWGRGTNQVDRGTNRGPIKRYLATRGGVQHNAPVQNSTPNVKLPDTGGYWKPTVTTGQP